MKKALSYSNHGLSLVELVIVIALIGVLSVASAPSMSEWIVNQRIRNTADSLVGGLLQAREESIRRNQPISLWLVSDLTEDCKLMGLYGSWVISKDNPANECKSEPPATTDLELIDSHLANDRVNVNALAKDGSKAVEVRFDGLGRLVSGNKSIAVIDVRAPKDANKEDASLDVYRSQRILIHGGGAIRLCDPRVDGASDKRKC